MILYVCAFVILYLTIGWLLAPYYAKWADNEGIDDPGSFAIFAAALWPTVLVFGAIGWALLRLDKSIRKRAGLK